MHNDVLRGLRSRGIDVSTAAEAGLTSQDDEHVLHSAIAQGRVLYSFNVRDFQRIHSEWLANGRGHAGMVLAEQERYSVGEQIRRNGHLVDSLSAEFMQNRLEFL